MWEYVNVYFLFQSVVVYNKIHFQSSRKILTIFLIFLESIIYRMKFDHIYTLVALWTVSWLYAKVSTCNSSFLNWHCLLVFGYRTFTAASNPSSSHTPNKEWVFYSKELSPNNTDLLRDRGQFPIYAGLTLCRLHIGNHSCWVRDLTTMSYPESSISQSFSTSVVCYIFFHFLFTDIPWVFGLLGGVDEDISIGLNTFSLLFSTLSRPATLYNLGPVTSLIMGFDLDYSTEHNIPHVIKTSWPLKKHFLIL